MKKAIWMAAVGSGVVVAALAMAVPLFSPGTQTLTPSSIPPSATTYTSSQTAITQTVAVFRSPTCGCCGAWIDHLKAAGFQVQDTLTDDLAAVKRQHNIPDELATCHTAIVGDYLIEGHVPAAEIQRLLAEQPQVAGLAVPGMPIGSPGMESGDYVEAYTVFAFADNGRTTAFAEYP